MSSKGLSHEEDWRYVYAKIILLLLQLALMTTTSSSALERSTNMGILKVAILNAIFSKQPR